MAETLTLWELTTGLEVGDKVLWIGEYAVEGVGECSSPNTVTAIHDYGDMIKVEGRGVDGGEYNYEVDQDGESRAYYDNPNEDGVAFQGPVVVARKTDSDDPVTVEEGFDE